MNEAVEASKLLDCDWNINSDVWSVTSYRELHKEAEEVQRWNNLHPTEDNKKSYLNLSLNNTYPIVAVSDYVKLVSEQISAYVESCFVSLGTDGFGRSDTRERLRDFSW